MARLLTTLILVGGVVKTVETGTKDSKTLKSTATKLTNYGTYDEVVMPIPLKMILSVNVLNT